MKSAPFLSLHVALTTSLMALGVGNSSGAGATASPNNLSLARAFPAQKLEEILLPRDQWHPFPTVRERERWQELPTQRPRRLLALGNQSLNKPLPSLPATLYLGYARTGNRSEFEEVYFERRVMLQNLVLAECVDGKGRFVDAAADALWSICAESNRVR